MSERGYGLGCVTWVLKKRSLILIGINEVRSSAN
jgi:hypothetical protein